MCIRDSPGSARRRWWCAPRRCAPRWPSGWRPESVRRTGRTAAGTARSPSLPAGSPCPVPPAPGRRAPACSCGRADVVELEVEQGDAPFEDGREQHVVGGLSKVPWAPGLVLAHPDDGVTDVPVATDNVGPGVVQV